MPVSFNNGAQSVSDENAVEVAIDPKHSNSNDDFHNLYRKRSDTKALTENFGRHRIFTWVYTAWGEESMELEDEEVVLQHGVPRRVLVKSIRTQIRNQDAFLTLPWALLIATTFAVCCIGHDRTNDLRDIEHALSVDLNENAVFAYTTPYNMAHKNVDDVHSTADVFSWLRIGFAPLLFRTIQSRSELQDRDAPWTDTLLTAAEKTSYLQYNRLVGGAKLSQTRAVLSPCSNAKVAGIYDMLCSSSVAAVDLDLSVQPENLDITALKARFDPYLTRWFLLNEDRVMIDQRLKQLESTMWIDNSTVHVAVHFLTYNAHFNSLTLTGAHFFFARTGHIWKQIVHSGVSLNPYEHVWVAAFDTILVLLVLRLIAIEILDIYQTAMARRPGSGLEWLKDYLSFWNIVDWISIGLSLAVFGVWIVSVHKLQGLEQELITASALETSFSADWGTRRQALILEDHVDDLMGYFEQVYQYQHYCRILVSLYPIVLMLRLFKAFASQPRLAVVTQTLSVAFTDVAHFLIVFFAIFSTFVVMAIALFGRELTEFSTYGRAFNTCFLVLMGEFDYEAMFAEARHMGSLWFWLFQIVLVLLMLNMLLAIIMDTYTEVKRASSDTETLPEQLVTLIRRWRASYRGERMDLKTIDATLGTVFGPLWISDLTVPFKYKWDPSEIMTLERFMQAVDGLGKQQAQRQMILAVHAWRLEHADPLSLLETMTMTNLIHRQVLDQSKAIQKIHELVVENHAELLDQAASINQLSDESQHNQTTSEPRESEVASASSLRGDDRIGRLELKLDLVSKNTNERLDRIEAMLIRMMDCQKGYRLQDL